jgi:hypothetical protein
VRITAPIVLAALPLLLLQLLLLLGGCPKEPEVLPGDVKDVALVVKLAELQQSELDAIGSFALKVIHDGALEREVALSFSASSRTLSFLEEPTDLPTTGTLRGVLEARDVLGQPIDIGGSTNSIDVESGGTLFAVVSRTGAAAQLGVDARAGANARAVGVGSGVLVVGDAGVQWIDLATGIDCLSSAGDDACALGAPPSATTNNLVVTALSAFGADCPQRGNALLTQDTSAWLFNPSTVTLTALDVALQTRAQGVLVPTADCRVLVAGGGSSTDILTFAGDAPSDVTSEAGPPIGFARDDEAAAATGNAIGEVLVIGGEGAAVVRTAGDVAVCSLGDEACNGAAAEPTCVRERPLAARVDDEGDLSPVLVFGGDCAAPELFRSAADAPFGDFLDVGAPNVPRRDRATLTSVGGGALLVGGIDLDAGGGAVSEDISFFVVDALSATTASGTWTSLGNLSGDGRSGHAAALVGGAVLIVGGVNAAGALVAPIEVVVPASSLSLAGGGA